MTQYVFNDIIYMKSIKSIFIVIFDNMICQLFWENDLAYSLSEWIHAPFGIQTFWNDIIPNLHNMRLQMFTVTSVAMSTQTHEKGNRHTKRHTKQEQTTEWKLHRLFDRTHTKCARIHYLFLYRIVDMPLFFYIKAAKNS